MIDSGRFLILLLLLQKEEDIMKMLVELHYQCVQKEVDSGVGDLKVSLSLTCERQSTHILVYL